METLIESAKWSLGVIDHKMSLWRLTLSFVFFSIAGVHEDDYYFFD